MKPYLESAEVMLHIAPSRIHSSPSIPLNYSINIDYINLTIERYVDETFKIHVVV